MILLWVALSMFAKDGLGTLLVIAESRGRHWLAGGLDAAGDVAQVVSMVFGAGEIIVHGWGWGSAEILAVMCAASFFGTAMWTYVGGRIKPQEVTRDNGDSLAKILDAVRFPPAPPEPPAANAVSPR